MSKKPFEPFCIVFRDYGSRLGQAWEEALQGQAFEDVCAKIISGDLDGAQRIIVVYPDRAPDDVTREAADIVIREPDLTDDILNFCETFGSAETKRAAKNEIRAREMRNFA